MRCSGQGAPAAASAKSESAAWSSTTQVAPRLVSRPILDPLTPMLIVAAVVGIDPAQPRPTLAARLAWAELTRMFHKLHAPSLGP